MALGDGIYYGGLNYQSQWITSATTVGFTPNVQGIWATQGSGLMQQYLADGGTQELLGGAYPVQRVSSATEDAAMWLLSNGGRVPLSGAKMVKAVGEAMRTAVAKPRESEAMAWLRGQVEEIRELAFA